MILSDRQTEEIRVAAIVSYEQRIEACGLIVQDQVIVCENIAKKEGENPQNTFVIAAEELRRRNIQAVWHSHNNGKNQFSAADVRACRKIQIPFVLHEVQNDRWLVADPSYDAAIEGAEFTYGVEDCYKVVCRYYWQTQNIRLKDYDRSELYNKQGNYVFNDPEWNEFRQYFELEGFQELSLRNSLAAGDVLLMQTNGAINANHIGVITDPTEGIFLHHTIGIQSRKDFWAGYWRENTIAILRKNNTN
jgi:proteasome lid subunit RPN8/RPN11